MHENQDFVVPVNILTRFVCAPFSWAARHTTMCLDVFALAGPPSKFHSDQGKNFKSHILRDLCLAFGMKKSRTTPYP